MFGIAEAFAVASYQQAARVRRDERERERLAAAGLTPMEVEQVMLREREVLAMERQANAMERAADRKPHRWFR